MTEPVLAAIGEGLIELSVAADERPPMLAFGGDAANVLVMAARMGARTRMGGRVGDDALGHRLLSFWRAGFIDVEPVLLDPGAPTGLYVNEPGTDGEHRFTYYRKGSAGSRLCADDLTPRFFRDVGILVVTGVTLAVSPSSAQAAEHAIGRARAAGITICCVLNHRPALGGDIAALAALARSADIVVGSREDAAAVFGVDEPDEVADALGPGPQELALTDGPRPATVTTAGVTVGCPVPAQSVRNAAGAGDAFAGAYLSARVTGCTPQDSLRSGVAASALSVRADGCAGSYPDGDAVRELVAAMIPAAT